jgi:F-type H+-transporting ATPase subunit b
MELLNAFGIDVRLLIANLINFLLLAGILYKLGYKPILKFVKERQEKIEQGVKKAEEAEEKIKQTIENEKLVLKQAYLKSQEIISKAREEADTQSNSIIKKAEEETKNIVSRAKKEILAEQAQSVERAKKEVAEIVILASEKILRKKINEKEDKIFIEETLKEIKK